MLERTEGHCIDCKTIIFGFIYLISVLRFLRIANKEKVAWLSESKVGMYIRRVLD